MQSVARAQSSKSSDSSVLDSPACDAVIAAKHPKPDEGGPCATCAFRPNTEANRTEHTQTLVRLCVEGFREFHCHEKDQLCRGYIAAINLRGAPKGKTERRRVDAIGKICDIFAAAIGAASMIQRLRG